MAIQVNFWSFAKRANSTALPDPGSAAAYNCVIKEGCSVTAPVLLLQLPADQRPHYNYCQIPDFEGRYYYIEDIRWSNRLWEISMRTDVLASWRASIGSQTLYVLRSSAAWDGRLQDNTYPTNSAITTSRVSSGEDAWTLTGGVLSVGIVSSSGETSYMLMSRDKFRSLLDFCFSDAYAEALVPGWTTVYPELKAQTNPLQYITSVIYLPHAAVGAEVPVRVGWVNTGITAQRAPITPQGFGGVLQCPQHPLSAIRGSYLNLAPYASYTMFVPGFGAFDLSATDIFCDEGSTVTYSIELDLETGHSTLELRNAASRVFSRLQTQIGTPVQVSQVYNKGFGAGGILATAAAVAGGLATGNVAGAIAAGASAIGDVASSQIPSARTIGSNGSKDGLRGEVVLSASFYGVAAEDLSHRGRPLCQQRRLDTIPGFIMCADADVVIPCTDGERTEIVRQLEEGIIYE